MTAIFITGTDTGVGKTFVTTLLLKQFNKAGYATFAIKPIASGSQYNDKQQLENDDALILQKNASLIRPYSSVNPIALEAPVAPHLAAREMGITLAKEQVKNQILSSMQNSADIHFIEGVGGWAVPLNKHELFSQVIAELNIPVILVVGIKLGCLNHALLTYENLKHMQVPLIGWVANCLDPDVLMPLENIQTLQAWIKPPCLGIVPYNGQDSHTINISYIQRFLF